MSYITTGLAALGSFALSAYYHREELTLPPPSKEEIEFENLKRECTQENLPAPDMTRTFALMGDLDTLVKIEPFFEKVRLLGACNMWNGGPYFSNLIQGLSQAFPESFKQEIIPGSYQEKSRTIMKILEDKKKETLLHFPSLQLIGAEKYQRFLRYYISGRKKMRFEDKAKFLTSQALSFFKKDIQVVREKASTLAITTISKAWETVSARCLSEDAKKQTEHLVGTAKWIYSLTPRSVKAVGVGLFFPGSLIKRALSGVAAYYLLP